MKCDCCNKEVKNPMSGQKYCTSCSLSNKYLRKKIGQYKSTILILKKKIWELEKKVIGVKK